MDTGTLDIKNTTVKLITVRTTNTNICCCETRLVDNVFASYSADWVPSTKKKPMYQTNKIFHCVVQSMTWHIMSPADLVSIFFYGLQSSTFFFTADVIDTAEHDLAIRYRNLLGIIEWVFFTCMTIEWALTFYMWHYWVGFCFLQVALPNGLSTLYNGFLLFTCGSNKLPFFL